jgi:hypothetical protein
MSSCLNLAITADQVFRLKTRYEASLVELNELVKKKKEAEAKAITDAWMKSDKTSAEVIAWIQHK